jgi:hypothetical protein
MPVISFIIDFIVETNENPAYHSFSVFTDFITGTISETQTNQLISRSHALYQLVLWAQVLTQL